MIDPDLLDCTPDATELTRAVLNRLRESLPHMRFDGLSLMMDLTVCHNRGHVDLQALLVAPLPDFVHDLNGIVRHLDRDTGNLEDGFLPRCHPSRGGG